MEMPLQLYALTWGQEDTQAIQEWADQSEGKFAIVGWSRVLLTTVPLHQAVEDPSISSLAIDGLVIPDHSRASADSLKQSLKKLTRSMLKLFSATNGAEPVSAPEAVQY